MTDNRQCCGVIVLFTYMFYVTGLHDPLVLRTTCLGLALGDTDDTTMWHDTQSSDTGVVYRPASIGLLLADKHMW